MDSEVKDPELAPKGEERVRWARSSMPVLDRIADRFADERPLEGIAVGGCLHVTTQTAVLAETLKAGGAEVHLCGSNPLSTQDDVAAYLAKQGINVYAWHGLDDEEYYWCVDQVLDGDVQITMDDGGDLVATLHSDRTEKLDAVIAGTEETTTGVNRFRAMAADGALEYPIVAVNDAMTKHLFDNRYGTGQSTIDGIIRATGMLLAGKDVVVGGYGWCGRGIAMRAEGMGARVTVTEVDPTRALEAAMDGFEVAPMADAAADADLVVTATGNKDVVGPDVIDELPDGAVLANSGHFDNEIDVAHLRETAREVDDVQASVEAFRMPDGRTLYLLGEGRLVNLAAAEGHPSEVMDMSFSNQALTAEWLVDHAEELAPEVHGVPQAIDESVAELKLEAMGIAIDELTAEQEDYLTGWEEGT